MVADPTQFLNLQDLFINEIAGNYIIFIVLSILFIFFLAIIWRMSSQITLILVITWILLISSFYSGLLAIVLFIIAIFVAMGMKKVFGS